MSLALRFAIQSLFATVAFISYLTDQIVLCVGVSVCVYLAGAVRSRGDVSLGVHITLDRIMTVALAAYSLSVPLHHLHYDDYDDTTLAYALCLCNLAAVSFALGVLAIRNHSQAEASQRYLSIASRKKVRRQIEAAVYVIVFGIVLTVVSIALTVGVQAYLNAGYAGRALLKRDAGPVELGMYHSIVGALLAFGGLKVADNYKKQTSLWTVYWLFVACFAGYATFLGIRRPTFFLVVSMATLADTISRRDRPIRLVATGLTFVVLFGLYSSFRQVLSDSGASQASEFISSNASFEWLDFSKGEMGAPFRALMDVTSEWDGERPRLGASYIAIFPNILPSRFGIHFPSLSEEYTDRQFSKEFIAIGGNMGFFAVAEAWVNFREVGVCLHFVGLGLLLGWLDLRVRQSSHLLLWVSHAIAAPWIVFYLRTDIGSLGKVVIYALVFPIVLWQLILYARITFLPTRVLPSLARHNSPDIDFE